MAYESDFRNCDWTFSDCLNRLGGGAVMLYKCVWFTPLINFRDATGGKERIDRKVGSTGLTVDQIKDKWRGINVAVAAEAKKPGVAYPLQGDIKAKIRINPAHVPKFKKDDIEQYAKYPLDALAKAGIYQNDSKVDATYKIDFSLVGSVEVRLWQHKKTHKFAEEGGCKNT